MLAASNNSAFVTAAALPFTSQKAAARCAQRRNAPTRSKRVRGGVRMRDRFDNEGRQYIRLEQFLKLQAMCCTGGEAKVMIAKGLVLVNGHVEHRRGRKLRQHDTVSVRGDQLALCVDFVPDGDGDGDHGRLG
ncbi:unnamed protein product [Agarophyton chilense]